MRERVQMMLLLWPMPILFQSLERVNLIKKGNHLWQVNHWLAYNHPSTVGASASVSISRLPGFLQSWSLAVVSYGSAGYQPLCPHPSSSLELPLLSLTPNNNKLYISQENDIALIQVTTCQRVLNKSLDLLICQPMTIDMSLRSKHGG